MVICFWEFCFPGKPISTQTLHQCTWLDTEITTCAFDICTERMYYYETTRAKVFHLYYVRWVDPGLSYVHMSLKLDLGGQEYLVL